MDKIQNLFESKKAGILNIYFTAGYPNLNDTLEIMQQLQDNGADIIELGMPYSDPLADGPVIQQSSAIALQNGMNIRLLFKQLEKMRDKIHIPVILMGYLNPVLQFGFDEFCAHAKAVGVDGLILPDLPLYEYETQYAAPIKKYDLRFIFLITPETEADRIKKIDSLCSGFLYAVSSSSTTGSDKNFDKVNEYLERLKNLQLTNPILVGFGIHDRKTFLQACENTRGAIIGSAFINALQTGTDVKETVQNFMQSILN